MEIDVTGGKKNELQTFWQQSDVDLSRGMDFTPRGSVFARFTHLQHAPFSYKINVNNQTKGQRQGTCRIFLAPKFDERGTNWLLRDQRHMFIELDRFVVNCNYIYYIHITRICNNILYFMFCSESRSKRD